ncbi:Divalent-cation tolerance protein CutA [Crateriforma conspicua]|uniref:Divalent-cation tolerance protein CutA n=1 Tax=Crateriforma conspicua TaxID=2527996 RepID=A0A5C6FNP6_9PLAN|nr:divalent-cation tolerance protein CutA [Crateriforma conspicua]TWU63019.1 Divalent-cation tolerance protein CutA [Crateriforma conspicua]
MNDRVAAMVQVVTTVETSEQSEQVAEHLLDARLAACIQVDGPIRSHYVWKDTRESASEYRLVIKTRSELTEMLVRRLSEIHPYETPEILVTPVIWAAEDYLAWVREQTDGA